MRPSLVRPAAAALLVAALLPATARAQSAVQLSFFAAQNNAIGGGPLLGGSIGGGNTLGLRVSGAMRTSTAQTMDWTQWRTSAFSSDVDAVVDSRDMPVIGELMSVFGGFGASLFTGAGVVGVRDLSGAMRVAPVFSVGGGASKQLGGTLYLDTEARRRMPVRRADGTFPEGFQPGWEYRAGLSVRFGGRRRSTAGDIISRIPRMPSPTGGVAGGSGTTVKAGTVARANAGAILDTGDDYLGTRYVYGGESPSGFDCSGFVQYVYARHDVRLPRTSRQQGQVGRFVSPEAAALRVGDLMLFNTEGERIDHVAIYAGDGRMLHSSSSGGGVRYDDLDTPRGRWFVSKMVSARRVVSDGRSLVDPATVAALLREGVKAFDAPDRAPRPR